MALRYSFDMGKEADLIDEAIAAALGKGLRTADIKSEGCKLVSTARDGRRDHRRAGEAFWSGGVSQRRNPPPLLKGQDYATLNSALRTRDVSVYITPEFCSSMHSSTSGLSVISNGSTLPPQ